MLKKLLSLILVAEIVLTACGGQTTENTQTPTPALATDTAEPATNTPTQEESIPVTGETETPSPSPSPSPTATVFVPENAADCVNKATFVTDVTIPDNSIVTGGTAFAKTWRVRNDGTCIWWSGYTLEHYSESNMSAPPSVPLPVTNPGDTADISVDLVAPSAAGTYRGNFVIKNPEDLIMQVDNDSRLWLIINVNSAATGTVAAGDGSATATPSGNSAASGNASCDFTTDATLNEQVTTAINNYRTQNTLGKYNVNAQLTQAAQAHAEDMACNQLFVHQGSDGSTPQTRVAATGYTTSAVSENVYGSYPPLSPTQVVTWWKFDTTDPNHNKNLISTKYTDIGVGYAFFNNYGYYVVVFATP